jgi:hypothetical protein
MVVTLTNLDGPDSKFYGVYKVPEATKAMLDDYELNNKM